MKFAITNFLLRKELRLAGLRAAEPQPQLRLDAASIVRLADYPRIVAERDFALRLAEAQRVALGSSNAQLLRLWALAYPKLSRAERMQFDLGYPEPQPFEDQESAWVEP
jgi:hypothetical protein